MKSLLQKPSRTFGGSRKAPSAEAAESFVGIKVLHEARKSKVDIVFIHGLTGDRERTWTAKDAHAPWPQTLLPSKVPNARILTFGYDAYVLDWRRMVSQNRIGDHAMNLLTALDRHRRADRTTGRPIIFVCHSLGGLVCEDALAQAYRSPEAHLRKIIDCTYGVMFVGTPHHGSDLAKWASVLAKSLGRDVNTRILKVLRSSSEVLARVQNDFFSVLRSLNQVRANLIEITCFYEELPLFGVGQVVPQHSAVIPGYLSIGIHANHMDMTRFSWEDDPGFLAISGELCRWTNDRKSTKSGVQIPKDTLRSRIGRFRSPKQLALSDSTSRRNMQLPSYDDAVRTTAPYDRVSIDSARPTAPPLSNDSSSHLSVPRRLSARPQSISSIFSLFERGKSARSISDEGLNDETSQSSPLEETDHQSSRLSTHDARSGSASAVDGKLPKQFRKLHHIRRRAWKALHITPWSTVAEELLEDQVEPWKCWSSGRYRFFNPARYPVSVELFMDWKPYDRPESPSMVWAFEASSSAWYPGKHFGRFEFPSLALQKEPNPGKTPESSSNDIQIIWESSIFSPVPNSQGHMTTSSQSSIKHWDLHLVLESLIHAAIYGPFTKQVHQNPPLVWDWEGWYFPSHYFRELSWRYPPNEERCKRAASFFSRAYNVKGDQRKIVQKKEKPESMQAIEELIEFSGTTASVKATAKKDDSWRIADSYKKVSNEKELVEQDRMWADRILSMGRVHLTSRKTTLEELFNKDESY